MKGNLSAKINNNENKIIIYLVRTYIKCINIFHFNNNINNSKFKQFQPILESSTSIVHDSDQLICSIIKCKLIKLFKMWACVLLDKNIKQAVPISKIINFNPEKYDPKKQFYINDSGKLQKATILFLKGLFTSNYI